MFESAEIGHSISTSRFKREAPKLREALLEAELFEPSFFLDTDPDSPARFVEAVRRRAIAVAERR